jgi:hypothetical protein
MAIARNSFVRYASGTVATVIGGGAATAWQCKDCNQSGQVAALLAADADAQELVFVADVAGRPVTGAVVRIAEQAIGDQKLQLYFVEGYFTTPGTGATIFVLLAKMDDLLTMFWGRSSAPAAGTYFEIAAYP